MSGSSCNRFQYKIFALKRHSLSFESNAHHVSCKSCSTRTTSLSRSQKMIFRRWMQSKQLIRRSTMLDRWVIIASINSWTDRFWTVCTFFWLSFFFQRSFLLIIPPLKWCAAIFEVKSSLHGQISVSLILINSFQFCIYNHCLELCLSK